jgi:hypothetical protein
MPRRYDIASLLEMSPFTPARLLMFAATFELPARELCRDAPFATAERTHGGRADRGLLKPERVDRSERSGVMPRAIVGDEHLEIVRQLLIGVREKLAEPSGEPARLLRERPKLCERA